VYRNTRGCVLTRRNSYTIDQVRYQAEACRRQPSTSPTQRVCAGESWSAAYTSTFVSAAALLDRLAAYRPPAVDKWIRRVEVRVTRRGGRGGLRGPG